MVERVVVRAISLVPLLALDGRLSDSWSFSRRDEASSLDSRAGSEAGAEDAGEAECWHGSVLEMVEERGDFVLASDALLAGECSPGVLPLSCVFMRYYVDIQGRRKFAFAEGRLRCSDVGEYEEREGGEKESKRLEICPLARGRVASSAKYWQQS
jgi:hypothetical protein